MTTRAAPDLRRLLRPRSIAIVGISPQPTSPGAAILRNIETLEYHADVHLVSRNRTEVLGRPCVPEVDALPEGIDLALLVVPGAAVLDAMRACARRKVGAAVVFASGFAELGEEGRRVQDELAAVAREAGIALLGPNCLGFVNYLDGLAATFSVFVRESDPPQPQVAFISQSGGTPTIVRYSLATNRVGLSFQISTGNEAVLGVEDFLDMLIDDERTRVVAVFCEQLRRPQAFLRSARRAKERGTRLVMLQPGASAAARASALSHTGAMVGDHRLIRTLAESAGVLVVGTVEELIDVTHLLVRFPHVPARGPALITDSGAFKGVELDVCDRLGLPVPAFDPATVSGLREVVPAFVPVENPLDVTAHALVDTELYAKTIKVLASDTATGATLISPIFAQAVMGANKIRSILPAFAATPERPAVIGLLLYDGHMPDELYAEAAHAGVALFRSPERALRALERVVRYGSQTVVEPLPVDSRRALPIDAAGVVPEYRATEMLAAAGVAFPPSRFVTGLAAAQTAAREIGYPVALKLQSHGLSHKTEAGAIALGLRDDGALREAWERLHRNVAAADPNVRVEGALVAAMAPAGFELIAGARRDPQWGTVLLAGLGGIWAEAFSDTVLIAGDASEGAILRALDGLRSATILHGTRNAPPLDVRAVARTLRALGDALAATPRVTEIELNPLRVYADGALALDALIVAG